MSNTYDVIIAGAGFAGIACAKELAKRGMSVCVLERKKDIGTNIHTTGILVHEAHEMLNVPSHICKEIKQVRLYSPSLKFLEIKSKKYLFLATNTPALMRHLCDDAEKSGTKFIFDTPFKNAKIEGESIVINDGDFSCKFLIGADGAISKVSEIFALGKNKKFLVGTEFEYEGITQENSQAFYCFLSKRFAPGYIGWVIPGPEVTQIGIAGNYTTKKNARPDLEGFIKHIGETLKFDNEKNTEKRGGLIPVGGLVEPFYNEKVVLVGDAAGIVSPLTAGGIHTAIFYGKRLGELTANYLQGSKIHPGEILQKEYPRFKHKLLLRFLFELAPDWGFDLLLKFLPFRYAAHALFFLKKQLR